MGKVLKVTWRTADDGSFKPILIESMQVAKGDTKSDLSVNFLAFEKTIDPVRNLAILNLYFQTSLEHCEVFFR